ncbi:MAG: arginine--tRNA ligase [Patescibacteria group bacterium]|nr:arginine--tRNA ligase [Patescibacteria group bacterium]
MYTLDAIKTNLARILGEVVESKIDAQEIVTPPKPGMGDLAFGCFKLAKQLGKSPNEIAKKLADDFGQLDPTIKSVQATGPYFNVTLNNGAFTERVVKDIELQGKKYGSQDVGKNKQVMLEYANLNTHKEFHVGHLRNILLGLSVSRILDNAGWKTIPVSYLNDMGSHVAKCLWLFVKKHAKAVPQPKKRNTSKKQSVILSAVEGSGSKVDEREPDLSTPSDSAQDDRAAWSTHVLQNLTPAWVRKMIESIPVNERTGSYLGDLYVESTKLLEENEDWKSEVSSALNKMETHDPAWTLLWQETRRWSYMEFSRMVKDFGVVIERQYFESDFVDQSHTVVKELMDKGLAIESRGAIIVDLENHPDPEIQKQKLGVFMIRKSDGTLIYAAKDIPLAELKFVEYPEMVSSIMVVDSRQSLYFKQLFTVLKLMGYTKPFNHLAYEFVTLPDGAMASRKGNTILLKDFMSAMQQSARDEILKRHDDWNEGKVEHTAWCIALAGVSFTILKQDPEKIIVFDMQKALAFDGDTGPYVQYAATRLQAILRKAEKEKIKFAKADLSVLTEESEKQLALCLAAMPNMCVKSAENFRPSLVAQWLLEAAVRVNAFYRDVAVMEAQEDTKKARLRLVAAAHDAIENGLYLLGIPLPDAM